MEEYSRRRNNLRKSSVNSGIDLYNPDGDQSPVKLQKRKSKKLWNEPVFREDNFIESIPSPIKKKKKKIKKGSNKGKLALPNKPDSGSFELFAPSPMNRPRKLNYERNDSKKSQEESKIDQSKFYKEVYKNNDFGSSVNPRSYSTFNNNGFVQLKEKRRLNNVKNHVQRKYTVDSNLNYIPEVDQSMEFSQKFIKKQDQKKIRQSGFSKKIDDTMMFGTPGHEIQIHYEGSSITNNRSPKNVIQKKNLQIQNPVYQLYTKNANLMKYTSNASHSKLSKSKGSSNERSPQNSNFLREKGSKPDSLDDERIPIDTEIAKSSLDNSPPRSPKVWEPRELDPDKSFFNRSRQHPRMSVNNGQVGDKLVKFLLDVDDRKREQYNKMVSENSGDPQAQIKNIGHDDSIYRSSNLRQMKILSKNSNQFKPIEGTGNIFGSGKKKHSDKHINFGKLILESILPKHQSNELQIFKQQEVLKDHQNTVNKNVKEKFISKMNEEEEKENDEASGTFNIKSLEHVKADKSLQKDHKDFYNSVITRYLIKDMKMELQSKNNRYMGSKVLDQKKTAYKYNLKAKDDTVSYFAKFERIHDNRPHPNLFLKLARYITVKPFKSMFQTVEQIRKVTLNGLTDSINDSLRQNSQGLLVNSGFSKSPKSSQFNKNAAQEDDEHPEENFLKKDNEYENKLDSKDRISMNFASRIGMVNKSKWLTSK